MAERRFIEHIIKEGDRWDLLAYTYWGNCNYAPLIIVDNPHLSCQEDLPENEICYIRESIADEDKLIENEALPFWKR